MNHQTIRIEGSILSPDILDKIENDDVGGQLAKDFGFESKVKVKDEIAKAWADANSQWKVFKCRIEKVKESETGTSETRKYWMIPFLGLLGYDVVGANAEHINGKSYSISHRDKNLDRFPVHIMGFNDSLDKKRSDSGPRLSPHSLVQEYLNLTEHLFALVTNGYTIRLLRDSSRLIKLSYIEFDLERMFEEDHYSDFAVMFRLLHSSRMPINKEQTSDSLIEKYHQDALDSGSRIRDGLSAAVRDSILKLGAGFLNHASNEELINLIDNNELDYNQYHRYLLRIIYRLLFVMVIEERGLIYSDKTNSDLKNIYYDYYSIGRLRKLCERRFIENEKHTDYWIHILNCFKIFEDDKFGKPLDIKPLAGDLFGYDAIGELNNCNLDNEVVIECIKNLSFFRNDATGQIMRVNYRSLNVEEFGSVYEGLLEFKPNIEQINGKYDYTLVKGSERSSSGSHYTEDELVTPLIKHSLDYIIEDKLKEKNPEKALLSITVCDVACGSGHILLNAARRIAFELAKVRTGEDFPSPTSYRIATRDVIKNCIYGVDKNPLAVELCKIALWLESHNPGEPLSFLDHKIKSGDSIVGLAHKEELERGIATASFNPTTKDDKLLIKSFKKKNNDEIKSRHSTNIAIEFKESLANDIIKVTKEIAGISLMPESNPNEVESKKKRYNEFANSNELWRLKVLADMQVAQFFIPKTAENKARLITDSEYYRLLQSQQMPQGLKAAEALSESQKRKFFHWFLEFPEIFEKGGFDCILGNPPYLGDKKLKKSFGETFLEFVRYNYSIGINDLVVYFFNRIYKITKDLGYHALITTSSISQGDLRIGALDNILKSSGHIIYAVKSIKWPGVASLNVAIVVIKKGIPHREVIELNGKKEKHISSFLTSEIQLGEPFIIKHNEDKMFTGYYFLGDGFLLTNEQANNIIKNDPKYEDVIFPFINGDDINENIEQENSRSIINFFDWPLDYNYDKKLKKMRGKPYATDYPVCLSILENLVKPERQRWKLDRDGKEIIGEHALRKPLPERWWIYGESRPGMREAIRSLSYFFATAQTTKYLNFVKIKSSVAVSQTAFVYSSESFIEFILLQSIIHYEWAVKYGNVKGDTFRYTPSIAFETFPFPQRLYHLNNQVLELQGKTFHEYRRMLMLNLKLGLTKTYNLFHCLGISLEQLNNDNKILISLQKHLSKTPETISYEKAVKGIVKLREHHKQMDEAVLEVYGWTDIDVKHDFYEVDYLPENDRIRYTIHPDARKEILKRLLELNHKIHEEEVAAGLWDKKATKTKKPKDDYPDSVNEAQGKFF